MINFKEENPKKPIESVCIIKCPEFCQSGYQIATWDNYDKIWTNDHEQDLTEYVIGWANLNLY